jgi:hypothetical protein
MTATISLHHLFMEDPEQLLTRNRAQDAHHSLGGDLANQFSWSALASPVYINRIHRYLCRNYDHVSGLWQHEEWIPESAVAQARAHYAAYSVQRVDGLRVITLNTDLCKRLFARPYGADRTYTIQGIGTQFLIQRRQGHSDNSVAPTTLITSIFRNLTTRECCDF